MRRARTQAARSVWPALWACVTFAVLAALTALGITSCRSKTSVGMTTADLPVAA